MSFSGKWMELENIMERCVRWMSLWLCQEALPQQSSGSQVAGRMCVKQLPGARPHCPHCSLPLAPHSPYLLQG